MFPNSKDARFVEGTQLLVNFRAPLHPHFRIYYYFFHPFGLRRTFNVRRALSFSYFVKSRHRWRTNSPKAYFTPPTRPRAPTWWVGFINSSEHLKIRENGSRTGIARFNDITFINATICRLTLIIRHTRFFNGRNIFDVFFDNIQIK